VASNSSAGFPEYSASPTGSVLNASIGSGGTGLMPPPSPAYGSSYVGGSREVSAGSGSGSGGKQRRSNRPPTASSTSTPDVNVNLRRP
jgi:hypothetical protein